jgi:pilus assembly protein FimV
MDFKHLKYCIQNTIGANKVQKMSLLRTSALMIYVLLASTSTTNIVQAEEANSYGPVKRGDSLWAIASKVSPPSVGIYQAILALHKANPHAFTTPCNLNSLKVGDLLRIPSLSEMQAITQAEASKEMTRQTEEWKNRRQTSIVCPQIPSSQQSENSEKLVTALTTEIADDTEPSITEPTTELSITEPMNEIGESEIGESEIRAKVEQPIILPTMASDALKPGATNTDKSDSPPKQEQEMVDNIQPVALSDNTVQAINADVDENTQTFDTTPSFSTIILLITIGSVFIAILIGWLLYKHGKRKANDDILEDDYKFPEPIDEMPYQKQEKESVSNKKTD